MLENQVWQSISGTATAEIYPIIKKVDVTCPNSYIIKTDRQIILIDPGVFPERMNLLIDLIKPLMEEKPRPVFLYLTHCHVDHSFQAIDNQEIRRIAEVKVAVQEKGAIAIEANDKEATWAELMVGRGFPPTKIEMRLLSEYDRENGGEKEIDLGNELKLNIRTERIEIMDGLILHRQIIPIGKWDVLEIYFTPGHSPDSVCIRIGDILLIGDILFSANPGLAGLPGWSQQYLAESIEKLLWLLNNSNISYCCPGHGYVIDNATARNVLHDMLGEVLKLTDVEPLDMEKAKYATEYALELLNEANEIFSIIAGRLYYISHFLDELGETSEAQKYQDLIEVDKIDELLANFSHFTDEIRAGRKFEFLLPLKAIQIIQKIEKVFKQDKLEHVIDVSLLRRATRLLTDFMNTVTGIQFQGEAESIDIDILLTDLLDNIKSPPYSEEHIINVVDNEEEYLAALVSRIAYLPVFEDVEFKFESCPDSPWVSIEKERFCDALVGIFEELAGADVKNIRICCDHDESSTSIRISSQGGISPDIINEKKLGLYQKRFDLCDGNFSQEKKENGVAFVIELPMSR